MQDAKEELINILSGQAQAESHARMAETKKNQVGSGQRGDKVRTIQFQNDSTVDHRNGKRITAKKFMQGHMDLLW